MECAPAPRPAWTGGLPSTQVCRTLASTRKPHTATAAKLHLLRAGDDRCAGATHVPTESSHSARTANDCDTASGSGAATSGSDDPTGVRGSYDDDCDGCRTCVSKHNLAGSGSSGDGICCGSRGHGGYSSSCSSRKSRKKNSRSRSRSRSRSSGDGGGLCVDSDQNDFSGGSDRGDGDGDSDGVSNAHANAGACSSCIGDDDACANGGGGIVDGGGGICDGGCVGGGVGSDSGSGDGDGGTCTRRSSGTSADMAPSSSCPSARDSVFTSEGSRDASLDLNAPLTTSTQRVNTRPEDRRLCVVHPVGNHASEICAQIPGHVLTTFNTKVARILKVPKHKLTYGEFVEARLADIKEAQACILEGDFRTAARAIGKLAPRMFTSDEEFRQAKADETLSFCVSKLHKGDVKSRVGVQLAEGCLSCIECNRAADRRRQHGLCARSAGSCTADDVPAPNFTYETFRTARLIGIVTARACIARRRFKRAAEAIGRLHPDDFCSADEYKRAAADARLRFCVSELHTEEAGSRLGSLMVDGQNMCCECERRADRLRASYALPRPNQRIQNVRKIREVETRLTVAPQKRKLTYESFKAARLEAISKAKACVLSGDFQTVGRVIGYIHRKGFTTVEEYQKAKADSSLNFCLCKFHAGDVESRVGAPHASRKRICKACHAKFDRGYGKRPPRQKQTYDSFRAARISVLKEVQASVAKGDFETAKSLVVRPRWMIFASAGDFEKAKADETLNVCLSELHSGDFESRVGVAFARGHAICTACNRARKRRQCRASFFAKRTERAPKQSKIPAPRKIYATTEKLTYESFRVERLAGIAQAQASIREGDFLGAAQAIGKLCEKMFVSTEDYEKAKADEQLTFCASEYHAGSVESRVGITLAHGYHRCIQCHNACARDKRRISQVAPAPSTSEKRSRPSEGSPEPTSQQDLALE